LLTLLEVCASGNEEGGSWRRREKRGKKKKETGKGTTSLRIVFLALFIMFEYLS